MENSELDYYMDFIYHVLYSMCIHLYFAVDAADILLTASNPVID